MKITKTFTSIFLLTFLIGYASVLPMKRAFAPIEILTVSQEIPQKITVEAVNKPEILEENSDWKKREDSFKIKLLETGEGFHGDEIEAKSGETWLGLFGENGKYRLEFTKLKIRRVHDSVIDGYEEKEAKQKTGKSLSVNKKFEPVLLLKNAEMLKEGEINTLYHGVPDDEIKGRDEEYLSLKNGFLKEFKIGKIIYKLSVKKGKNKNREDILALILENGKTFQTLHSLEPFGEDDYLRALYWAGDLDRDEKPDFYFSLYFHDNVEYRNLFLSSEAEKGKLVKKAATFTTTGC
ncbi:MAG TPA: hypothetical protein VNI84_13140 [Pyrinomonadaceae bacterium]|nr:hypothetical protein [Pyrinomonadaceae bacterium]